MSSIIRGKIAFIQVYFTLKKELLLRQTSVKRHPGSYILHSSQPSLWNPYFPASRPSERQSPEIKPSTLRPLCLEVLCSTVSFVWVWVWVEYSTDIYQWQMYQPSTLLSTRASFLTMQLCSLTSRTTTSQLAEPLPPCPGCAVECTAMERIDLLFLYLRSQDLRRRKRVQDGKITRQMSCVCAISKSLTLLVSVRCTKSYILLTFKTSLPRESNLSRVNMLVVKLLCTTNVCKQFHVAAAVVAWYAFDRPASCVVMTSVATADVDLLPPSLFLLRNIMLYLPGRLCQAFVRPPPPPPRLNAQRTPQHMCSQTQSLPRKTWILLSRSLGKCFICL